MKIIAKVQEVKLGELEDKEYTFLTCDPLYLQDETAEVEKFVEAVPGDDLQFIAYPVSDLNKYSEGDIIIIDVDAA